MFNIIIEQRRFNTSITSRLSLTLVLLECKGNKNTLLTIEHTYLKFAGFQQQRLRYY